MYDSTARGTPALYAEWLDRAKRMVYRIKDLESAMAVLATNYARSIPHCRLILYAKKLPARIGRGQSAAPNPRYTGRPRGLYWGRVTRTGVIAHLKGRLTNTMVWKIALRSHLLPLFRAFEAERLHLMRNRSSLVKAREDLRKVLTTCSKRPLPVAVSTLLTNLAPLGPRDYPIASGLYNLASEVETLPAVMERLVQEFRARAPARCAIRFLLWQVDARYASRRFYFTAGRAPILPERLTKRMMRRAGLDEPGVTLLVEFRTRAIALNRAMHFLRARVVRVRHLLRRADVTLNARRPTPRRTAPA